MIPSLAGCKRCLQYEEDCECCGDCGQPDEHDDECPTRIIPRISVIIGPAPWQWREFCEAETMAS